MGKILFIALTAIFSVSFLSCSKDKTEEVKSNSIVGTWQEKKVEGMNEQYTFTFNSDGTGQMDLIDFAYKDLVNIDQFNYSVDYATHRIKIDYISETKQDVDEVFTVTDGYILEFWNYKLYKR
jgi:hypothetical protein